MSSSLDQYTAVMQIYDAYAAIHVQPGNSRFISQNPTRDLSAAKLAAIEFAIREKIPCDHEIKVPDKIYTVWKSNGQWYPAEIHPDKIRLLTGPAKSQEEILGGSLEFATNIANALAGATLFDFIPELGIAASQNT